MWEYSVELATWSEGTREASLREGSYGMSRSLSSRWPREGLEESILVRGRYDESLEAHESLGWGNRVRFEV